MGRAETVFNRPHDAELVAAVAFEINYRVDHMLQHARAGNLPVFGYMADQHQWRVAVFGEMDKLLAGDAYLTDRARCRFNGGRPHGLDGIDNHQSYVALFFQRLDDIGDIGGGRQMHIGVGQAEARRAHT